MRWRSRASTAALARSRRYLRSTLSMNAEREGFDPAKRSTFSKISFESVLDVFSFIPLSYYQWIGSRKLQNPPEKECRGTGSHLVTGAPPPPHTILHTS